MEKKAPMSALVAGVQPGSIAAEAGLEVGDRLLLINGESMRDLIDYKYLISDEQLLMQVIKSDGEEWQIEIIKEYDEDLGLSFESAVFDGIQCCSNRCVFCFIDQNPPGLRSSLYVTDDDYRLSCLQGNFVTLTNLSDEDWERIARLHLSPLYVSVHAMQPDLREGLLGTPKARQIKQHLDFLAAHRITVHAQIVLCPGLNDGERLEYTISGLAHYYPSVRSVAVVPVGLTKFRKHLPELRLITREETRALIGQLCNWQKGFLEEFGTRFVWLADEFYLTHDFALPARDHYEDLPQMANGVGLTSRFYEEFEVALQGVAGRVRSSGRVTMVSGILGAKALRPVVSRLQGLGVQIEVRALSNLLFGEMITATGLLGGQDIISQLVGQDLGDEVLLPWQMLRSHGSEPVFLDDVSLSDLRRALHRPVTVLQGARELVDHLLR